MGVWIYKDAEIEIDLVEEIKNLRDPEKKKALKALTGNNITNIENLQKEIDYYEMTAKDDIAVKWLKYAKDIIIKD